MSSNNTPNANRAHIGFFGSTNAGKSSLVNAVTNQPLSIVSPISGTTTDPVHKTMELLPFGPVVIIDTPGFDDCSILGELRIKKTKEILAKCDLAVLVSSAKDGLSDTDAHLLELFKNRGVPFVVAYNKADEADKKIDLEENAVYTSATDKIGIDELKNLSENFRNTVDEADEKFIVVGDRFPLMYLCEEYGISYEAAYPGCSAQVEANPTVISRLINKMKEHGTDIVFKVDLSTGLVAETISESTGAEVETLYSCHVISAEDFDNGETYISLMERNMNALSTALS